MAAEDIVGGRRHAIPDSAFEHGVRYETSLADRGRSRIEPSVSHGEDTISVRETGTVKSPNIASEVGATAITDDDRAFLDADEAETDAAKATAKVDSAITDADRAFLDDEEAVTPKPKITDADAAFLDAE